MRVFFSPKRPRQEVRTHAPAGMRFSDWAISRGIMWNNMRENDCHQRAVRLTGVVQVCPQVL